MLLMSKKKKRKVILVDGYYFSSNGIILLVQACNRQAFRFLLSIYVLSFYRLFQVLLQLIVFQLDTKLDRLERRKNRLIT